MDNKVRVLTKDGNWLYGVYPYLGPNMGNNLYPMSQFWQWIDDPHNQIRRETISWFTGLKDKNGKVIYEGDILQFETGTCRQVVYQSPSFVMKKNISDKSWTDFVLAYTENQFETVIGNIWQNPELLEGK